MKNKKKQFKKLDKKVEDVFMASEVGALVENFNHKLQLSLEIQSEHGRKLDKLDERMDRMEGGMDGLENETRQNFKLVFEHFSNIEDELQDIKSKLEKLDKNKVDKKEFDLLKIRVERLEKELKKCKARSLVAQP